MVRVLASDVTRVSSAGLVVFRRASVNTISRDSSCSICRFTSSYVVGTESSISIFISPLRAIKVILLSYINENSYL